MFEFFIALFGGVYYAGKCAFESSKTAEYDRKTLEQQSRVRGFESYAVYKGSQKYFYDEYIKIYGTYGWRNQMREDLASELRQIYGDEHKTKRFNPYDLAPMEFPKAFYLYDEREQKWAYHLYLSKHGLVDSYAHLAGYTLGWHDDNQRDLKICRLIESNLNKKFSERGQPLIKIVQVPDGAGDWNLYGGKLKFAHTLTPAFPHRILW